MQIRVQHFQRGWQAIRRAGLSAFGRNGLRAAQLEKDFPALPILGRIPTVSETHFRESVGGLVTAEAYIAAMSETGRELGSRRLAQCRVILVSSVWAAEGKSAFALNLAAWLAKTERVMIVDGDLRSAGLSRRLALPSYDAGLTELICQAAPYKSCLAQTGVPNLHAIRSGALSSDPTGILGHSRMAQTLRLSRRYYGRIIVDSPALSRWPDACLLAQLADAVILMADPRLTRAHELRRILDLLNSVNANVAGIVLNQAKG